MKNKTELEEGEAMDGEKFDFENLKVYQKALE
jgi:hypothetical protein